MPKDINLKDLHHGDTVAYAVSPGRLRIGVIEELPPLHARFAGDHVWVRPLVGRTLVPGIHESKRVALVEKAK